MSPPQASSEVLRRFATTVLPGPVRHAVGEVRLAWLRTQLHHRKPGAVVRFKDYLIRMNDGANVYVGIKDIFVQRIYHFESRRPEPVILDCGANIGLSTLYFARTYPRARIRAFEPDPVIIPYLRDNITLNRIDNVQLIHAAVAAKAGTMQLYSDGKNGSCLAAHACEDTAAWPSHDVACVRLRDYLAERVDFLKMNIEGAEWEVLADIEDRLSQVDQMVIEYHHLPGLPRTLHLILALLHRRGFEVLINDFDAITNPGSLPPFRLEPASRYFLLIYARAAANRPS